MPMMRDRMARRVSFGGGRFADCKRYRGAAAAAIASMAVQRFITPLEIGAARVARHGLPVDEMGLALRSQVRAMPTLIPGTNFLSVGHDEGKSGAHLTTRDRAKFTCCTIPD
jgi:hypothetical protein